MDLIPFIGISIWLVFKIMILILLLLYIFFAFVVIRQVNLMIKTLDIGFGAPLKSIAVFHLLFASATFILAVVIL